MLWTKKKIYYKIMEYEKQKQQVRKDRKNDATLLIKLNEKEKYKDRNCCIIMYNEMRP